MAHDIRSERFPGYRLAGPLGGRYTISRLLAAGGMAEVYEAHDSVLDRRVAIKVLHATYGSDAEFVERFRREAMAAGKLNHPNIVQVYDWGRSEEGASYMVMELVDGKTLREILRDHGPLSPATAARIVEQVCAALEVARRAGIVHRDIKPENILIGADGRAKVADFGVARALAESRATQAGTVLGTATYLAPEQVEGHPGDHRSDLYSLGTVLYELIAGEPPFRGDNPVVVAYRRVAEDVPPLRTARTDAPEALETIVARATARDPDRRYQTAAELAADLAPLARGAAREQVIDLTDRTRAIPVSAAQTQVIRRRVPRKRRRLRRVLVLATVIGLMAALVPLGVRAFGKVTVPDVTNLTQEAATRAIERAGLEPEPVLKNHPTVPQGSVISMRPQPDSRVRRGTKITIAISLGPTLVTVPSVLGKTQAEAVALLEEQNLVVAIRSAFHSTRKGVVFFQDPGRNVTLKEGQTVTITVSRGPEQIAVPNVNGKTYAQAKETLEKAGFVVALAHVDSDQPRETVLGTDPAGGAKADKGSTVTVRVSNGPREFPAPDVRSEKYSDAVGILASYGLKAGRKQVPGSYGDTVISQVPNAGKKVKRGDTIILYTA